MQTDILENRKKETFDQEMQYLPYMQHVLDTQPYDSFKLWLQVIIWTRFV